MKNPQSRIQYLDRFPKEAKTGTQLDWQQTAAEYLSAVFDPSLTGDNFPLCSVFDIKTDAGYEGKAFSIPSYVGIDAKPVPSEGLTCLGSALCACLAPDRENWDQFIQMAKAYFSKIDGRGVVTNSVQIEAGDTGKSFWYDLFPSILYVLITSFSKDDQEFMDHAKEIADTWCEVADNMQGDWEHTGYSVKQKKPNDTMRWFEPDAAQGIAYIAYIAYVRSGDTKYLDCTKRCLDEMASLDYNPYYEILGSYAPYTAARMEAETGIDGHLTAMLQTVFSGTTGTRTGWGIISERWGEYDAYGLSGSITDTQGYAFGMNTYATAAGIAPTVRYAPWLAKEIARYLMHVRRNSALFFAKGLPDGMQSQSKWVKKTGVSAISYEGVRKNGATIPYATGDARLDMNPYGAWGSGLLASLFPKCENKDILLADIRRVEGDRPNDYPLYLVYNPTTTEQSLALPHMKDAKAYDLCVNAIMKTPNSQCMLAPGQVCVLCCIPKAAAVVIEKGKAYVENQVIDYYANGWETAAFVPDIHVDYMRGAKMTSSSCQSLMYCPSNAATSDWHDAWCSIDNPLNEWLGAELHQQIDATRINIIWHGKGGEDSLVSHFTVEASLDGEAWETIYECKENNRYFVAIPLHKKPLRYIRINCLNKKNRRAPYGITDIQVFAN